jgi:hypothetical protein
MRWSLAIALAIAGCGARSTLADSDPIVDLPLPDASAGDGGERHCPPNCTVGHECCVGGCGGPPADMLSDCCACLPGEISSFDCGALCGE